MLQGVVLERIQASLAAEGDKRMIYLGDGVGDYCPSLKLNEVDFAMPRKNFPVWDLISKNPLLIKAEIHEWTDGEDFEKILLRLIDRISIGKSCDDHGLITADHYKILPIISVPVLPKPLVK